MRRALLIAGSLIIIILVAGGIFFIGRGSASNPVSTEAAVGASAPAPPGALPSRLVVGGRGVVNEDDPQSHGTPRNVNLRALANATKIGSLQPGADFTVVSGPVCANGMNWYQVNVEGQVGWLSEGSTWYFVTPISIDYAVHFRATFFMLLQPHRKSFII